MANHEWRTMPLTIEIILYNERIRGVGCVLTIAYGYRPYLLNLLDDKCNVMECDLLQLIKRAFQPIQDINANCMIEDKRQMGCICCQYHKQWILCGIEVPARGV
eukprot:624707_1